LTDNNIVGLPKVLSELASKGVDIGTRWRVVQEGNNLIFRDMVAKASGQDKRYQFSSGVSKNL
jgi:hypothetical protein